MIAKKKTKATDISVVHGSELGNPLRKRQPSNHIRPFCFTFPLLAA
jgi:hypothetical protein